MKEARSNELEPRSPGGWIVSDCGCGWFYIDALQGIWFEVPLRAYCPEHRPSRRSGVFMPSSVDSTRPPRERRCGPWVDGICQKCRRADPLDLIEEEDTLMSQRDSPPGVFLPSKEEQR